jgi:hypothetical protein
MEYLDGIDITELQRNTNIKNVFVMKNDHLCKFMGFR